jgi:hypothetical protein
VGRFESPTWSDFWLQDSHFSLGGEGKARPTGRGLDGAPAGRAAGRGAGAQQDWAIDGVFAAALISVLSWFRLSWGTMVRALLRARSPWRVFLAA